MPTRSTPKSRTCSPPARTSSRSTSPICRRGPAPAEEYGLAALNRALEGVTGTTAVHICFGYAAIIHERPSAYSFLPQLKGCRCRQISIETAQSNLDCAVLSELPDKKIILGVLDLSTPEVETPETVAARIRRALRLPQGRGHHRRAGLRPQISAARLRLRQDEGDGRGGADRAGGSGQGRGEEGGPAQLLKLGSVTRSVKLAMRRSGEVRWRPASCSRNTRSVTSRATATAPSAAPPAMTSAKVIST